MYVDSTSKCNYVYKIMKKKFKWYSVSQLFCVFLLIFFDLIIFKVCLWGNVLPIEFVSVLNESFFP